jgi:hypothetical protein
LYDGYENMVVCAIVTRACYRQMDTNEFRFLDPILSV